jgi:hypothetical protein
LTGKGSGKKGRPLGFKLSESSKRAISVSKTGQCHRPETKEKISKSLLMYFRRRNPLSEEIIERYCRMNDDMVCSWLMEVKERLDATLEVMTDKSVRNKSKIEITCGNNIEFLSHNMTPELIVMFKDYCEKNDLNPEEALDGGSY